MRQFVSTTFTILYRNLKIRTDIVKLTDIFTGARHFGVATSNTVSEVQHA
jgi:hypothetical protein